MKEALDYLDKLMNECKHHPDLVTKIGYFELKKLKDLLGVKDDIFSS